MSGAYGGQWREMVRMEYWREGVREFVKYTPNGTSMSAEMWGRRHRRILFALFAHLPVLLAIGLFEGSETQFTGITIPATPTWLVLTELGIVAGLGGLATWSRLGRRTRTVVAAFGLMTTSGLLVQFTGGYIEAHFHFFVVMGTIAIYEDWLPFLVGLAHVAVGHGVFSTIDSSRVYNHEAAIQYPWAWAVIHATFILMLVAALMTNWQSIERSREEADRRLEEVETKREEIESARAAKAEARDKHAEVQRLNEELAATADRYGEVMARAAAGDMTARIEAEDTTASMARIAASFDEMMDEMEAAVAEVSGFADEVLAASETAAASVSQAETASRTTTESVETISGSAVEQREMLDEVASEMSQLSATVEEVASSTASVAQRAEETAAIAQEGTATADEAAASTREVESTIETTVENVRSLDEQMTEIGEIADLIRDIAEQTNMLALNANIEAARAGGSGEDNSAGFAVVAGEVKSLAEETQQAATDIEDRIEAVQRQTTATVEEVQTAQRHTQASLEAVGEVREAFDRVAENADRTDEGVSEISRATDDQAASTEQAVSMVEDVAAISRSTADAADETTAATEQLSTAVSAVADETASLTDRAARLRDRLQAFETSQTATDGQLATDGGAD